jgi:hypothetical protein
VKGVFRNKTILIPSRSGCHGIMIALKKMQGSYPGIFAARRNHKLML